jgi:ankyrin repeat protein
VACRLSLPACRRCCIVALHMACANGHVDIVLLLLEAGAVRCWCPASRAALPCNGCWLSARRRCIKPHVDAFSYASGCSRVAGQPNRRQQCHSSGWNATTAYLLFAVLQSPDVKNADGNTPLHWACLNGQTEVGSTTICHLTSDMLALQDDLIR